MKMEVPKNTYIETYWYTEVFISEAQWKGS